MPRKKPFSAKQKKRQLQEKRERKRQDGSDDSDYQRPHEPISRATMLESIPDHASSDAGESDTDTSESLSITDIKKINEQPTEEDSHNKYDPNRYRLHFQRETRQEIERRKETSRKPFKALSETNLEMSLDDIYRPGTSLDMPKRPKWDYSMSKEQVEQNEEKMFVKYLDKIYEDFKPEDLSYFELNLETWRQLWRVLELSDIVLLITDIRFPVLHFSPALYKYVTADLQKYIILVLNKIDLAPASLVAAWKNYFQERFPKVHIICFSSFPRDSRERGMTDPTKVFHKKRPKGKRSYLSLGPKELCKACEEIIKGQVDLSSWYDRIDVQMELDENCETHETEAVVSETNDVPCPPSEHEMFKNKILSIGCVGHPNVGKSSLLNALVGNKVVSVSRTPGHTKHFQTIFLTPTVRLVDSPGLVFPSIVEKPLQVLAGIYPVAQVQEPYTAVGYLAERIPLVNLLRLKHPNGQPSSSSTSSAEAEWSAWLVCDAWAEKRGFLTARAARNDVYRAANNLLRLAQEGRLRLCLRPPGYTKRKVSWEQHPETHQIELLQNMNKLNNSSEDLGSTSDPFSSCSSEEDGAEKADQSSSATEASSTEKVVMHNPYALLAGD